MLALSAGRADDVALIGPQRVWTYRELDAAVAQRAASLSGAARGAPVPLVLEPDAEGVLALLAHWRAGLVPAPLNPRLTDAERKAASLVLDRAPAGAHVVVWTSGTEGRPRGVALSWDNLAASARGAAERLSLGADDVWLASLPLAHVGGLALVTRSLLLGGALAAFGPFEAGLASELVDARELAGGRSPPVSHLSLVPTQLLRLLDHRRGARPPGTLRCALVGGAHAPSDLVERAHRAGWPIALTYGATEMSSQIATAPPELALAKPGTVGRPLAGVEVRVEAGEILARGDTRAIGSILAAADGGGGTLEPLADEDGWYHTGDLGRVDEDGHLWVTGRRVDRIVSGGVTVDAVEVEEALRRHPAVLDACVVGVPDPEWGERVGAWIVPAAGELDPEEVGAMARERLSAAKLPRVWYLGGSLPRNANGKVDRPAVRRRLEGAGERGATGGGPLRGLVTGPD